MASSESLRLNPRDSDALTERGQSYFMLERYEQAVENYKQAIRFNSNNARAFNNLAWLQAACPNPLFRNATEAIRTATTACDLTRWKIARYIDTLAAASAEAGDFEKAIKYEKYILLLEGASEEERKQARQRLSLYVQHRTIHQE